MSNSRFAHLVFSFSMFLSFILLMGQMVRSQELVQLVADNISTSRDNVLTATGNVEIIYRGEYVRAQSLVYDKSKDTYHFEGPLLYDDGSGLVVISDYATMSKGFKDGILQSARFIVKDSLQLTSRQILRADGRYSELDQVRASSCYVCAAGLTPLWEVRATKAIHDKETRRIYYDDFQLRLGGVPIFYAPRLRTPEPSVKRATGFLTPQFSYTTDFGGGIRLPFFIPLNTFSDLTFSPFIKADGDSNNATAVYRKAFPKADLTIGTALSYGNAGPLNFDGSTASVIFTQPYDKGNIAVDSTLSFDQSKTKGVRARYRASGNFNLPKDYKLNFLFDGVLGDYYLLDDNYTDRMYSNMTVSRVKKNQYLATDLISFRSVRPGETNSTVPSLIFDNNWQQRFYEPWFGGAAGLKVNLRTQSRSSKTGSDTDSDGISDGRDTDRMSIAGDWRKNWVFKSGVVGSLALVASSDQYNIKQDDIYEGRTTRTTGVGAVELRWPFVASDHLGGAQVIEPVAQLVLAPNQNYNISNEDSTLVEFDEGSLFSIQRFSGYDARERGNRLNLGLGWTRIAPTGWELHSNIGKVIRPTNYGQFSAASGLSGVNSDLLASVRLSLINGLTVQNRFLLGSGNSINKNELRLGLERPKLSLSASYVSLLADTAEGRSDDVSEVYLSSRFNLSEQWTSYAGGRYNFKAHEPVTANLNLNYINECLHLKLALLRRYTSSTGFDPNTDFTLDLELLGFSNGSSRGRSSQCGS
ncbi:MAG: LPS assembly protein LptD [Paracoccaceae bacterium]|jgi:LPS-assembly protein